MRSPAAHCGPSRGGEQKRIALEVLLRGDDDVLLLDEPDNFLDVPAKRWLEGELRATRKTILFVSHDRELLAATATRVVTVEASGAWTHGGGFAGYHEAREARLERLTRDRSWFDDERQRLVEIVVEMRRRAKISDGVRPEAQGGGEPAAPVRRDATTARPRCASRRSTSGSAARAPASGP